jgi:hypothetical protein
MKNEHEDDDSVMHCPFGRTNLVLAPGADWHPGGGVVLIPLGLEPRT